MALFEWNDFYSVNHDEIDEQHKILVGYLNELFEAMKTGEGFNKLNDILDGLVEYTVSHFSTESVLMRKNAYPEMKAHFEEHKTFVKEIEKFQQDFKNKKMSISSDVLDYLKNWLQNHILKTDKKLGRYLQEKSF